ncbi:MAG: glycosyltransferase family 2 protein [Thermoplasmatota archaeon]
MPRHFVVLATYARADDVKVLLGDLAAQTRPPDEVVVVDDTPDGSVEAVAKAFDGLPVTFLRPGGRPSLTRARNLAREHLLAAGDDDEDLVTFFDSDVRIEPDHLEQLAALTRRRPGALGYMGWVADYPRGTWWKNRATALLGISSATRRRCRLHLPIRVQYPVQRPRGDQAVDWLYGCNMTVPRRTLAAVSFDGAMERYGYGEDLDFSLRARATLGGTFWMTGEAVLRHGMTDDGRLPPLDVFRMRLAHRAVLTHRHAGGRGGGNVGRLGPLRAFKLWWGGIGNVLYYSQLYPERASDYRNVYRQVRRVLRRRRADVRAGRVEAFNDLYTFLQR